MMSEGCNNGYRTGLCRFCANEEQPGIEIFSPLGQEQNLFMKIQLCHLPFEVTMTDTLPVFMCYSCIKKLNMFHEFYNTAIGIQSKLKEICTLSETKGKNNVVGPEDKMKEVVSSKDLKPESQGIFTIDLSLDEDEKPVSPKRQKLMTAVSSGQSSTGRTGFTTPPKSNPSNSVSSLADRSNSQLSTSLKVTNSGQMLTGRTVQTTPPKISLNNASCLPDMSNSSLSTSHKVVNSCNASLGRIAQTPSKNSLNTTSIVQERSNSNVTLTSHKVVRSCQELTTPKSNPNSNNSLPDLNSNLSITHKVVRSCQASTARAVQTHNTSLSTTSSVQDRSNSNLTISQRVSSTTISSGSSQSNWVPPRGITIVKKGLLLNDKSNSSKSLEGKVSEPALLGTIDITGPKETNEEVLTIDITDSIPTNLQQSQHPELTMIFTPSANPPTSQLHVPNGDDTSHSANDIMSVSSDSDATLALDQSPPRPSFAKQVGRSSVPRTGDPS